MREVISFTSHTFSYHDAFIRSELSKTVATFILQKILLDETGLYYICQTYDRLVKIESKKTLKLRLWLA